MLGEKKTQGKPWRALIVWACWSSVGVSHTCVCWLTAAEGMMGAKQRRKACKPGHYKTNVQQLMDILACLYQQVSCKMTTGTNGPVFILLYKQFLITRL